MNDVMLFLAMGFTVFLIIISIIYGAVQQKSYIATPEDTNPPKRDETKPLRNQRAQVIWNRLNPKMYLDDDETEPLPQKIITQKVKQR